MFPYLAAFWLLRTTKFVLFYLYLWQLKEYHLGRFFDHFRTEKGKGLLWNPVEFLKILILAFFFIFPYYFSSSSYGFSIFSILPWAILILFAAESLKALRDIFQKNLKLPAGTKKTVLLALILLSLEGMVIFSLLHFEKDLDFFAFWLLLLDVFTFIIVSAVVLLFQPIAVLIKYQTIRKARQKIQEHKDLLIIGITGSYGKSSTKEFLYTLLSQKPGLEGKVLKTKENQNSEAGISQCILNDLTKDHKIFIVEMGAYGKGGIKLLCNIAKPHIGILTGVNEQHQSLFGSQKTIMKTKYELIESLPENGLAVFNGSDKNCFELYKKTQKPRKLLVSLKQNGSDLWAESIISRKNFVFFKACDNTGCNGFKIYVPGSHFVQNLLSAILVAKECGMDMEEIVTASLKIRAGEKTMQVLIGQKGITVIDDSYSANPASVFSALEYLKIFHTKKIIVLPSLIELGGSSKKIHEEIGRKIGEVCDAAIVTTKDRFKEIKIGALDAGFEENSIFFSEKPKEITETIKKSLGPEDVVLLEGRVSEEIIKLLTR
ncbi:Mur ligase family protein [Patescibacteria group bacterium]